MPTNYTRKIFSAITSLKEDFLDRSARIHPSRQTTIDALKIALPATIAGLADVTDFATKMLGSEALYFISNLLSLAITGLTIFVISSKDRITQNGAILRPSGSIEPTLLCFKFPQGMRQTAKVLVPIFVVISARSVWEILPNGIKKEQFIAGYVCNASTGIPVSEGSVEVLDTRSQIVSTRSESLEDTGFFMADLLPMGQKPQTLRVTSKNCGVANVSIQSGILGSSGCPKAEVIVQRSVTLYVWNISCPPTSGGDM